MEPLAFGRMLKSGQLKDIYNSATDEFRQFIAYDQLEELVTSFNEGVVRYELFLQNDFLRAKQYIWLDNRKKKAAAVTFNGAGEIQSLYFKPYVQFDNACWSQNLYQMPICDSWYVFWGGTNEFFNYHYIYEQQRFAYDLVIEKDGRTYQFTPERNENFYAFGKHIVAPCDGEVVQVVNHLPDNVPGEFNEAHPAGNYVVIEHANKEFSLIAHFRQQSIAVNVGQIVTRGQYLGECGNSGNSSEPHIHFQVMDSMNLEQAKSLRIQLMSGVEPRQGELVSPPLPPPPVKKGESTMSKIDKLDDAWTLGEVLLFVPRLIFRIFKDL